jgi:hypothetical protein
MKIHFPARSAAIRGAHAPHVLASASRDRELLLLETSGVAQRFEKERLFRRDTETNT